MHSVDMAVVVDAHLNGRSAATKSLPEHAHPHVAPGAVSLAALLDGHEIPAPSAMEPTIPVRRHKLHMSPDPTRVITLPLDYAGDTLFERLQRLLQVDDHEARHRLASVISAFDSRHRNLGGALLARWRELADRFGIDDTTITPARRLLVAAYLTKEFSIEGASLCNPSIVALPDQTATRPGELRVLISLRAIGEGHSSSIEFRTGVVAADGTLTVDAVGRHVEAATAVDVRDGHHRLVFDAATRIDERVLWGTRADERHGLEDARLVALQHPDGSVELAATCVAYDGRNITVKLVRTRDLISFDVDTLTGPGARDKGIAIFPRQIAGRWWAASRQDGQRTFVMTSSDLIHWDEPVLVEEPVADWELVQQGNCGSPIETDDGWLMITHGVGLMRRYVLSAVLLDLDDPTRVVARLGAPLLEPDNDEREGYVPNVVYSCGALAHRGHVVVPYAASDQTWSVASFALDDILSAMVSAEAVQAA